jgi:hypothetical protein
MIGPVGETDFVGQNIGGSGRQNTKRNARPGNSIHSLVDGAVATRRENEIAAILNGFTGKLASRLRAGSSPEFYVCPGILQDTNGVVQTYATGPFEAAGERVVDDSDTMG